MTGSREGGERCDEGSDRKGIWMEVVESRKFPGFGN